MKRSSVLVTAVIVILSLTVKSQYRLPDNDSLEFPFIERFTEGSLEVNNWVTDCENWSIENGDGIPAPSVRFTYDPELGTDYNCTLTSDWLSKDSADVFLKFEYKVLAEFYTEEDNLYVEIFDSINWTTVGSVTYYYEYWHDWKINLTPYINNSQFKIRFRANGNNSSNLEIWAIDNILVYNGIMLPEDIIGEYYWGDEFGVQLSWELKRPPGAGGWGAPKSYSYWENCGTIGLIAGGNWAYAVKWDSLGIGYDDANLFVIEAFIGDTDFDSLLLKVWKGQNGEYTIYSKDITGIVESDQWNSFYITPPIMPTDTSPTWFGIEVYGQQPESYPAGIGCNDPYNGYGNLYKLSLDSPWDTLPDGYSNWNFIMSFGHYTSRYMLEGYNIYRMSEDENIYTFYDYVEHNYYEEMEYYDIYPNVNIQTSYYYQVRSAWINHWVIPEDTMVSIPGYAKINGDDNFVSVLVTDYAEQIIDESFLIVYPNPFSNSTTIEYTLLQPQSVTITFYNQFGKQVDVIKQQHLAGLLQVVWNPVLPVGIYYFRLEAGEQVINGKVLKIK